MNELIPVTRQDIGSALVQTVSARELHAFLEVGKVFAAWIQERIEQYGFSQGVDFEVFSNSGNNPKGGRPSNEYAITLDMAKELSMVERNEKGRQARRYFIECERKLQSMAVLPDFTNPVVAARAWIELYEAKDLAEKTKAEIGSRREATAMNTASQAVKKVNRLEIALDQSMQYATVKRMEMLYHGQSFNWRLLKSTASVLGLPAVDVYDANYGTVKAYHADVWREAYAIEIIKSTPDSSFPVMNGMILQ